MFKQKYRKSCLNVIKRQYPEESPALMADRHRIGGIYYSVWSINSGMLEVIQDQEEISIYQYRAV